MNIQNMETRSTNTKLELRAEKENLTIEGYFAVFEDMVNLYDDVYEKIDRAAFNDCINNDIRALINHDHTLVIGRTVAKTLELKADEKGLYGKITINPSDTDAKNLYERVKRGDVNQCSIGFFIEKESYDRTDDERLIWTIEQAKLYEVSVCTFPAYENTRVEARQKVLINELEEAKERLRKRLKNA